PPSGAEIRSLRNSRIVGRRADSSPDDLRMVRRLMPLREHLVDVCHFLHLYCPVVLADYERPAIGAEAPPSFGIVYQFDDARGELLRTLRRDDKSMDAVVNPIAVVTHISDNYWKTAGHRLGGASS